MFWGIRVSDDGVPRKDSFTELANAGEIQIIAPARLLGYAEDGKSVHLSDGTTLKPKAVLLATGYQSSWSRIFKRELIFYCSLKSAPNTLTVLAEVAAELGINCHAPQTKVSTTWAYKTLQDPPPSAPENEKWVTSIYRGLVPGKNIDKRDFAIAGSLVSTATYESPTDMLIVSL